MVRRCNRLLCAKSNQNAKKNSRSFATVHRSGRRFSDKDRVLDGIDPATNRARASVSAAPQMLVFYASEQKVEGQHRIVVEKIFDWNRKHADAENGRRIVLDRRTLRTASHHTWRKFSLHRIPGIRPSSNSAG